MIEQKSKYTREFIVVSAFALLIWLFLVAVVELSTKDPNAPTMKAFTGTRFSFYGVDSVIDNSLVEDKPIKGIEAKVYLADGGESYLFQGVSDEKGIIKYPVPFLNGEKYLIRYVSKDYVPMERKFNPTLDAPANVNIDTSGLLFGGKNTGDVNINVTMLEYPVGQPAMMFLLCNPRVNSTDREITINCDPFPSALFGISDIEIYPNETSDPVIFFNAENNGVSFDYQKRLFMYLGEGDYLHFAAFGSSDNIRIPVPHNTEFTNNTRVCIHYYDYPDWVKRDYRHSYYPIKQCFKANQGEVEAW